MRNYLKFAGEDGYQESHWHVDEDAGIMASRLEIGHRLEISEQELYSLDVLGWDVNYQAEIDLAKLERDAKNRVSRGGFGKYDRKKAEEAMEGKNRRGSNYGMGFMAWRQEDGSAAPQDVPEPASVLALFSTALLGLAVRRKRV